MMEKMRTMLMHDIEESWPTDVIEPERKNIEAEGIASGEGDFLFMAFLFYKLGREQQ